MLPDMLSMLLESAAHGVAAIMRHREGNDIALFNGNWLGMLQMHAGGMFQLLKNVWPLCNDLVEVEGAAPMPGAADTAGGAACSSRRAGCCCAHADRSSSPSVGVAPGERSGEAVGAAGEAVLGAVGEAAVGAGGGAVGEAADEAGAFRCPRSRRSKRVARAARSSPASGRAMRTVATSSTTARVRCGALLARRPPRPPTGRVHARVRSVPKSLPASAGPTAGFMFACRHMHPVTHRSAIRYASRKRPSDSSAMRRPSTPTWWRSAIATTTPALAHEHGRGSRRPCRKSESRSRGRVRPCGCLGDTARIWSSAPESASARADPAPFRATAATASCS